MSDALPLPDRVRAPVQSRDRDMATEGPIARAILIGAAGLVLTLLLVLPLATIFIEAVSKGVSGYLSALTNPDAVSAAELTLATTAVCVPINTAFGFAAAWAIARFDFVGKQALGVLIDLPLSVSPVIVGLAFVLLFGARGVFAPLLSREHIQIIFAFPGIALVTLFVTFPYVARELIPLMQQQGSEEEQTALTLGASPWSMFRTVTLPNIRFALLSGILLCNARAVGEFGAVTVVSGRVRGLTNTLPLHIEALYESYDMTGAFAVASLLALLGLFTLAAKILLERRFPNRARRRGRI